MYVASYCQKLMYSQQRYKMKREKERERKLAKIKAIVGLLLIAIADPSLKL